MHPDSRPVRATLTDQTAAILRKGLTEGRWSDRLPGAAKLARELGVSAHTVRLAQHRLREEGMLTPAGERRALRVHPEAVTGKKTTCSSAVTRVAILNRIPVEAMGPDDRLFLLRLMKALALDGHRAFFVDFPKGRGPVSRRLAALVRENEADLWLINTGTGDILRWFERGDVTALALGGQFRGVTIPVIYATMREAVAEATARLVGLGHTRIVMLVSGIWRQSPCHSAVTAFVKSLEAAGIRAGTYHLPEWRETPEGLATLLDELFRVTPPTAILCLESNSPHGVLTWLARHGLAIPRDVSVVTFQPDPGAGWASPGVELAHCGGEDEPGVRKVVRWVADAAAGNIRRTAVELTFRFIPGDSIGPAPKPGRK